MERLIVSQNNKFAQYQSIQAAINAASPGAIICIDPGIYYEKLFVNKNIELVGNGTPEQIIVESQREACVFVDSSAAKLTNITFKGTGEANQFGAQLHKGEIFVKNCVFSSSGTGVYIADATSPAVFEKCLFHHSKWGLAVGNGVNCKLMDSTITANSEGGIKAGVDSNPLFQQTKITHNRLGAFFAEKANGTLDQCQFSRNQIGVQITHYSAPIFNGCRFDRNELHIDLNHKGIGIIHNCRISGGDVGIRARNQGHANITETTMEAMKKQNVWLAGSTIQVKDSRLKQAPVGVYVKNALQSRIENTTFTKHGEAGIMLEDENDVQIKDCQIIEADCGVCFQKQATGELAGTLIEASAISGIAIIDGSNPKISDCTVKNGQRMGLLVWSGKGKVTNCHFINNTLEHVYEEGENQLQLQNCSYQDNDVESEEFIQSEKPPGNEETMESVLAELHSYIGLDKIKNRVADLIDFDTYSKERTAAGVASVPILRHHSIFLGKPGTGKTTVARLMGKIFYHLGLLKKGHIVEVDRSALVGEYVGQTTRKTNKAIDKAKGGVLFIDEAYTLIKLGSANDFGKEALELILKRMEDEQSFIVIAAGYQEEMQTFIEANPGLKDRFKNQFYFDDFTPDQLLQIFEKMLVEEEYATTYPKESILQEFTDLYRKRDRTFGNARMVRTFFEEVKMNHAKRCVRLDSNERTFKALTTITDDDIEPLLQKNNLQQTVQIPVNEDRLTGLVGQLQSLIGLEKVKREVRDIIKLVKYYKEEGLDYTGKFIPHSVFLGNPGTGKTTVARLLSQIYEALGILPVGDLIETSREDLVAGYVGQTAIKTTEVVNLSIGSTLFIDEAYSLSKKEQPADFGQEAIDTILKRMEDDRGKFVLIAAGYTEEMVGFLRSNPGLNSRFGQVILFEDYTPEELLKIAESIASKADFCIDEPVLMDLLGYFEEQYRKRDRYFSNARFVRNIIETTIKNATLRIADMPKELRGSKNVIERIDLPFSKNFV
ncbi:right-handed parallel beta-helix repeat-containing protein [Neobacillus sp. K501]